MASAAFDDIADTFAFLEDWEDRYRHLIELGKAMPPLDEAFRVPATKVDGCASQVWLLPRIEGRGQTARFDFQGESDAMIVRGLVAVLHALYSGLTVTEVLAVDAGAELKRLGWTRICLRNGQTGCAPWWHGSASWPPRRKNEASAGLCLGVQPLKPKRDRIDAVSYR